MSVDINFNLHESQLAVFDSLARFKVVVAGRRFGKSYLACVTLLLEALKDVAENGHDLQNEGVFYVAPTFESGKRNVWDVLKSMAKMESEGGLIRQAHENTAVLTLVNGRKISIKGADRPDSLRGAGLSYVVLDEYAFMKSEVWEKVIAPTLTRSKGGALFIGTPEGKNHFYDLYQKGIEKPAGYQDWESWHFESLKNPTLDPAEIAARIATMSVATARQEYGASFNSGGGEHLKEEWWKHGDGGSNYGNYYVAVDLAGFADAGQLKRGVLKQRDEHAITVAKCDEHGWFVEEIITGQWDVRECALQIVKAYSDYRPVKLGIEKGALKNACGPYLADEMKRLNRYFLIHDLTHGGQDKHKRILWALQGRLEKGRITLNNAESFNKNSLQWQRKLVEQANDFPSSLAHDDMIDSLAYIDQLQDVVYGSIGEIDTFEVLDLVSGM